MLFVLLLVADVTVIQKDYLSPHDADTSTQYCREQAYNETEDITSVQERTQARYAKIQQCLSKKGG